MRAGMYSNGDTIVAIATPEGRGALGVVRLSGPEAYAIALRLLRRDALRPRHATFATLHAGSQRDQVVATWFPTPRSYTGEDIVELSAHGSGVVLRAILDEAMRLGARLAEPGEFTLRAFLNGRIDLPQAEAVADLIDAVTPLQARTAFDQLNGTLTEAIASIDRRLFDLVARLEASVDFPDEGYHFITPDEIGTRLDEVLQALDGLLATAAWGRLVREGARVAIVGRTNAGKSSLFNALVGANRAIVSEEPGTTRDLVSEVLDLGRLRVTLVDTAGFRSGATSVEREGMDRTRKAMADAALCLIVWDGSLPLHANDTDLVSQISDKKRLIVQSKADMPRCWVRPDSYPVSAVTGEGLSELIGAVRRALSAGEDHRESPALTNVRHVALVERAAGSLRRAVQAVRANGAVALPEEFVLADLQDSRAALEEVTGRRAGDEILEHVFRHFCVGK